MITVVIICFNEERNIARALDSVAWCDNVVVIDSFSRDATEAICRSYPNVTFIQHAFENFAQQRQYSLTCGAVKHPWVLALDADESVPGDLRDELLEIAGGYESGKPVAYDTAMRLIMWGKWMRHSSEYPVYWRRFIRADRCRFVQEGHADKVVADGPVGRTRHDLVHDDARGLDDWLAKHNRYTSLEADYALGALREAPLSDMFSRDRARRRRTVKRIFRAMPFNATLRFIYLYVVKRGFLDGRAGFEFCLLRSFQHFVVKLKMRERTLSQRNQTPADSVEKPRAAGVRV